MVDGFTLIELLVVISIIATLAALLIPSVAMVRMQARQSTFASNQKQVAIAIFAYADNNDDYTPCRNTFPAQANQDFWFQRLASDYLGDIPLDLNDTPANDQRIARSLFRDPMDATKYPGWGRRCVNLAINGRVVNNGSQWWGGAGWQDAPVSAGASNRPRATIAYPSQLLLLGPGPRSSNTALGSEWGYSHTVASWAWLSNSVGPSEFLRYNHGAPVTYADGHSARIDDTFFWTEISKDRFTHDSRFLDGSATNP